MSETSIISISIGEECSVSAIKDGVSIDCSAGLTPTSGVIMGTNPGSVDASVIFHMLRNIGLKWKEVESVFSDNSGFGAVSGWKSLPYLINSPKVEKVDLDRAIEVLCYQLRKYVGMYLAVIGKADAIVFSGEVGVMSSRIRKQTLENLYHLGIKISAERNSLKFDEYQEISESTSVIRVFVMESNDQSFIAKSVSEMLVPDT